MKLILIRHGMTEANAKRLYCGRTDIGLSSAGRAMLLKKKDEGLYPDISGMRVITSGMKRCEETLLLLYGDTEHETDAYLREMDFGDFEMRSYEELKTDPRYIQWISGDNESNPAPNGESGRQMTARVINALDRVIDCGSDTLIITHGGVIAAIMQRLFPDENKSRYERQPDFGSGYIIDTNSNYYYET